MQDLINDLLRRAEACKRLAENYADAVDRSRCLGKADAYKHAAEMAAEMLEREQTQIVGERLFGLR